MSDLHIEVVESLMEKFEKHLAEPMDVIEEFDLCAEALERSDYNEQKALLDLLGFNFCLI